MARSRTMVSVSWSLQRAQFGEQPVWLGVVLAAMLGQFGLPGGGFGHGYGSGAALGTPRTVSSPPALPQLSNSIDESIPVTRITDMLLRPCTEYDFNGERRTYPDIRLVYWAGRNPFHHHQDLARLREAFTKPDTVIVHEAFWTATARHADVVLPCTMTIERNDYGAGMNDPYFFPMPALTAPHGQARDDYAIFADLARRLGVGEMFTEGRNAEDWLRHLYDGWRGRLATNGHYFPPFDDFWDSQYIEIPAPERKQVFLADFRADPQAYPLNTPSGRIEIFSETIDAFSYPDCPGHPVWMKPTDWLDGPRTVQFPVHLVANQPRDKLHSQLDIGDHSRASKIHDRAPMRMHPEDATARGLTDGEVVRVFNDRGACLVGVVVSTKVCPGVVQLSTGAWYDPEPGNPQFCRHGNPNVLTADIGSSTLSQGCSGQHCISRGRGL